MVAGGSAAAMRRRAHAEAIELSRRARDAYEVARKWGAAERAERQVAACLVSLTASGWHLLVDRRWPGTRSANIDMILIGRAGVFVIDVKRWREAPTVDAGRLRAGDERRDSEIGKLSAMTRVVEERVAALGLSPVAVRPVMVFAGHRVDDALGSIRLLGEPNLVTALTGEPRRLTTSRVRETVELLEEAFPEYEATRLPERASEAAASEAAGLFDVEEVEQAALDSLLRGPIERWMTYLHPDQIGLVRRDWNGPARISGPAGTGKTVVGLHRAAHLAARTRGRVLFVTFANNLPRVLGSLIERMAPQVAEQVEFTTLHGWALTFLRERGVPMNLDRNKVDDAFSWAWKDDGRTSVLKEIDPTPGYWRDEIAHIIKGRGITTLEQYRSVTRHGRRTALRTAHREAVWLLHEEYELLREQRGVHDFDDLLLAALDELHTRPLDHPYSAVIVDEVQDLTLIGVKLLHTLAGDERNALLLIGDGQQKVYPGGFRLAEAGVDVRGRGAVLRTNYRNAAEILDGALELVSADPYDDLEGPSNDGRRVVESAFSGGTVIRAETADVAEHDRRLVTALTELRNRDATLAGTAVLCPSLREVEHHHRLLTRAGLPVIRLEQYDGRPVDAIKLGTYRRVKGLEFKSVFLPRIDGAHARAATTAPDNAAARERAELARRQLFVAMTRARDLLWLGSITDP